MRVGARRSQERRLGVWCEQVTGWQYQTWPRGHMREKQVWAQKNDEWDLCEPAVPRGHLSGSWKVKLEPTRESCQDVQIEDLHRSRGSCRREGVHRGTGRKQQRHACVRLHWERPPALIPYGDHWPREAICISLQIIKMTYDFKFGLQSYQPRVRCSAVL